jgi:hypothetical protein
LHGFDYERLWQGDAIKRPVSRQEKRKPLLGGPIMMKRREKS